MIALFAFSLLTAASCVDPTVPTSRSVSVAHADSTYQRIFEGGVTFETFLDKAEHRKEQWKANYQGAVVPDALVTRGRATGGGWKLLIVAVSGCSDSVNTIPYIAKLAEAIGGVDVRIVDNTVGGSIMEAHRTPDGRAATPTVLLLDASYAERGCFIERPAALRQWMTDEKAKNGDGGLFSGKMKWYDEDKGARTIDEIVAAMEAASKGEKLCG